MNDYRYEIKFILNQASYSDAMQWLYVNTNTVNKYPNRYINSIYLDNLEYDSVKANLSGIGNREKRRIRWYDNDPSVKLETKVRNGRLSRKEMIQINLGENFSSDLSSIELRSNINNWLLTQSDLHFDYFASILGVRYLRQYYEDNSGLRITFDHEIQFTDLHDDACSFSMSNRFVNYAPIIMEIKFDPHLKDYANSFIRRLNMTPKRHSKYLVGMAHLENVVYI
jgi:hypothetical protein